MSATVLLAEVEKRIFDKHGDTVKIVPESYAGVAKKARFLDRDFGEWETFVTCVFNGHGHKLRGKQNSQKTNLKKYGSKSPLGNEKIRSKIETTNLLRYGCSNAFGNKAIRQAAKDTMLERYGVDNPQKNKEIREKTLATNVERFGVQHPYQSEVITQKMKQTNLEHWGVENPWQSPEIRDKIKSTCLRRYGAENPAQSSEAQKKSSEKQHRVTVVEHWRTGEKLKCIASYEAAFVEWCNKNRVDFDWQVKFVTPVLTPGGKDSVYFVDTYIKTGTFAGTYVEIKGTFNRKNGDVGRKKWEWFHAEHQNSQLWDKEVLVRLGILTSSIRRKNANV
jgi:hypothetical protein